ncbi:Cacna1h, partial [Symbiodinium sp. CCMP2456]
SDKTADSNNGSASAVLRKVVTSSAFGYGIMFLILANMVILGVEVDASRHLPPDENPDYFFIINNSIVCLFVLEIILKLMAFGCKTFFCGRDRGWNIFDCIIVALSLVESASDLISRNMAAEADTSAAPMDAGHLRVARFTRLIRALRGVRVVRLLRFISSLRAILFSISSTLGSLAWTLVLLMIVFYCFGVIIAQLVSDHCRYHLSPEDPEHLRCAVSLGMWDGVPESMMTLFHSITGGLSWVEAFTPLREISSLAAAFMYVYIVMTVFAVLNVVTGVFCNTAIENAKADKDIAVMKQMQKHRTQVEALRAVFNDIEVNQSKLINLSELKVAMQESKLGSFMESMDISTKDIWTLFMLIDADESGEISIDEFVAGCIEIQGPAKSIQLA